MDMYNLDGSRGAMCENRIRCVGKYAYDHGIVDKPEIDVETCPIKQPSMKVKDGKGGTSDGGYGDVHLRRQKSENRNRGRRKEYRFTGLSMGNPHAGIVFMDGIKRSGDRKRSIRPLRVR